MRLINLRLGSRRTLFLVIAVLAILACNAQAAAVGDDQHLPKVLVGIIVILLAAKLGGDLLMRLGQPAVLGELIFGILVGNLVLVGYPGLEYIKSDESIRILSEIGVIILLFQVGLESDLNKMMRVGASSFVVATLGIAAPFFLGWGVSSMFLRNESVYVHIFIGAALCATSVGITARVLRDLKRLQTPEARIVLGAAVIDDVQGLIILAAVIGIIKSAEEGVALSSVAIMLIVFKAILFLAGAILLGRWLSPKLFRLASHLRPADLLLTTALAVCFGLAYAAKVAGLAPIVGAFAAGLILEDVHWKELSQRESHDIEELVRPIAALLVPVFFVRMGAEVDLRTFMDPTILLFAGVLTAVAIIGKQVCAFGVLQKGLDKLSVGIGMVPRGEVGLIFASIGAGLTLHGEKIVKSSTFSAIIIMVVITTMITPPALKWSLNRAEARRRAQSQTEDKVKA